jgi:hypothetical protein
MKKHLEPSIDSNESVPQPNPPKVFDNTITAITVAKSITGRGGFQSSVIANPNYNEPFANIETASDSVQGDPMNGHDYFHAIANNLIRLLCVNKPQEMAEIMTRLNIDSDNPAGFDYKGERLAMVAQYIVRAFKKVGYVGEEYLEANLNDIPNPKNPRELARLIAKDMRTSLVLNNIDANSILDKQLLVKSIESGEFDTLVDMWVDNSNASVFKILKGLIQSAPMEELTSLDELILSISSYRQTSKPELIASKINDLDPNLEILTQFRSRVKARIKELIQNHQYSAGDICDKFNEYYTTAEFGGSYSINKDIMKYYESGTFSTSLEVYMHMFTSISEMTVEQYFDGIAELSKLFLDFYFEEYDSERVKLYGQTVRLMSNQRMTQFENDVNVDRIAKPTLNNYSLEDATVVHVSEQERLAIKSEYIALLKPLSDKLDRIMERLNNSSLSDAEYNSLHDQLNLTKEELSLLKLTPRARELSSLVVHYYGYVDL